MVICKLEKQWLKNGKIINCKVCDKSFYISKSRFPITTCCSKKCSVQNLKEHIKKYGAWNRGLKIRTSKSVKLNHERRMETCKKRGYVNSKETKLKISKGLMGKVSPMKGKSPTFMARVKNSLSHTNEKEFTGFKNKLRKRIRASRIYLQWRSNVFKRDNYTCQKCGERSGKEKTVYLEVHHIVPFMEVLRVFNVINLDQALSCKPLWDVGNGITYCKGCHIKSDKNIGKALALARK